MGDDVTFDLDEAAAFLKMSKEALRRRVKAGEIPGVKARRKHFLVQPRS